MTNLEHTMLYMCFGAMTGWTLCSIGFIIADIVHNVKEKSKRVVKNSWKQLKNG